MTCARPAGSIGEIDGSHDLLGRREPLENVMDPMASARPAGPIEKCSGCHDLC